MVRGTTGRNEEQNNGRRKFWGAHQQFDHLCDEDIQRSQISRTVDTISVVHQTHQHTVTKGGADKPHDKEGG